MFDTSLLIVDVTLPGMNGRLTTTKSLVSEQCTPCGRILGRPFTDEQFTPNDSPALRQEKDGMETT